MKRIFQTFVLLVITSASALCQQYSQSWTDVNYAGDGQGYHNLDIYLPSEVKDKYPVVIYIYGSAWYSNSGKGADMGSVGAELLDAGFAVVTPNHRSSSDAKFPAQLHDIKAVVRYVRGMSATYSFDTSFIATSGSSSGGHLATLTGTTNNEEDYSIGSATINCEGDLGDFTEYSSSVDAIVDFFGPIDFHRMEGCTTHKSGSSPEADIIGGDAGQNLDMAALLGPINYVDANDPPILIFHGTSDNVVPSCQSEFLYDEFQSAGVESQLVIVSGGQHGPGVNDNQDNLETMIEFLTSKLDPVDPPEQLPFNDLAHVIPGLIEAEEYDLGGEGLGYHETDNNGNEGGATFRNDQVDIEDCTDAGGGYNLGYTLTDEWVAYTVNVLETGDYDLDLRLAKDGDDGSFYIEIDGQNITGSIDVPNTGGWQTWETVTIQGLSLTAGEHEMTIVFETEYTNINYVEFKGMVTGNNESVSQLINIYPNPFSAKGLNVDLAGAYSYVIKSVGGSIFEKANCSGKSIIGKNLPSGIYFLTIENASGSYSYKVIR